MLLGYYRDIIYNNQKLIKDILTDKYPMIGYWNGIKETHESWHLKTDLKIIDRWVRRWFYDRFEAKRNKGIRKDTGR